jgi:hypothetical protein
VGIVDGYRSLARFRNIGKVVRDVRQPGGTTRAAYRLLRVSEADPDDA